MNPQSATRNSQSSILAVHPGALGDVILFGHLLGRLHGTVTLVAGGEKGKLLEGLGVVDRALEFDALPIHEVFTDTPLEQCRCPAMLGEHDRLISCFAGSDRSAELRLAAMCAAGSAAFLPTRPPPGSDAHLLELWADLLGVDLPTGRQSPPWAVPEAWKQDARGALREAGIDPSRSYAAIHPGSGSPDKCWDLDRFVALGRRLGRTVPAVFLLGPVERERWGRGACEAVGAEFPTLLCPPLTVLAAALAAAKCYVGNDSGVSHLAATVGTPALVIFGPTSPRHFAPVGKTVRTLAADSLEEISVAHALDRLGEWRG